MKACSSASGGVIFVPQKLERKLENPVNDNDTIVETAQK
jgi:hypothetical protein